jgi:hypothetical protein
MTQKSRAEFEQMMKETREKAVAKRQRAEELSAEYPDGVIVLRKDQPETVHRPWVGAIIHPSPKDTGRYQVSIFDDDGFSMDYSEASYRDAIYQAITEGYRAVDMDLLDRVGETPRFMAGCLWSMLPDNEKWSANITEITAQIEAGTYRR